MTVASSAKRKPPVGAPSSAGAIRKDAPRYRLKLESLDFISAVDEPAQQTAKVLLIKRGAGADRVSATAQVAKVDDELGLVFCWAFTSTLPDGSDHFDLQNDCIDQDFVKAAADFMQGGGAVDEMHDGTQTGRVVFCMPMTADVAKAFGVETDTIGLMVALKPSPDALAKFKSGEYTGVSMAGMGTRTPVGKAKSPKCASCGSFASADAKDCPGCGNAMKKSGRSGPTTLAKAVCLTTASMGHCHLLDDGGSDAPSVAGYTSSESMPAQPGDAYGNGQYHTHPWSRSTDGTIVIGEAYGHAHELLTATDLDAIVASDGEANVEDDDTAVALKRKETPMADTAEITKLRALAEMTDIQKAHHAKLDETGAAAFRALSRADRDSEVSKADAADGEVYKAKDGTVYRKSDDRRMVELAKRVDADAEIIKARQLELDTERLSKRAGDELQNLPGDIKGKIALLKAVDSIADETERTVAKAAIAAGNSALAVAFKRIGHNGDTVAKDANGKFDAVVKRIRAADPKLTEGQAVDKAMDDAEGRAAYLEIQAAKSNPTATGRMAQHGA